MKPGAPATILGNVRQLLLSTHEVKLINLTWHSQTSVFHHSLKRHFNYIWNQTSGISL